MVIRYFSLTVWSLNVTMFSLDGQLATSPEGDTDVEMKV